VTREEKRKEVEGKVCERCEASEKLLVHHKNRDHSDDGESNREVLCKACHYLEHREEIENKRFVLGPPSRERLAWRKWFHDFEKWARWCPLGLVAGNGWMYRKKMDEQELRRSIELRVRWQNSWREVWAGKRFLPALPARSPLFRGSSGPPRPVLALPPEALT